MRLLLSLSFLALLVGCGRSPSEQVNLGVAYHDGEGVPQDEAEAVKWLRLAAEQGLAQAQADLH